MAAEGSCAAAARPVPAIARAPTPTSRARRSVERGPFSAGGIPESYGQPGRKGRGVNRVTALKVAVPRSSRSMTVGRAQAGSGRVARRGQPELSEGTKVPGEPASLVPSPSPGWTWPLRFRTLALQRRGEPRRWSAVSCRAPGLRRSTRSSLASSIDPDPVPSGLLRPKPSKGPLGLDPVPRPSGSKPPGAFDQRAGPVRLIPGSPRFSAPPCPSA